MPAISTRPPIPAGPDETTLVAQAKHDRHAFALLYHRYVEDVYRYCYRRLGSKEEAEDATSQVFTKALAGIARLAEQPFRAWLFTILHNLHLNAARKRRNAPGLVSLEANGGEPPVRPTQEDGLEVLGTWQAFSSLPEPQRAAILLITVEEMSYQEAAAVLGIPVGTLMSRLHRGRERLRMLIRDPGADRMEDGA